MMEMRAALFAIVLILSVTPVAAAEGDLTEAPKFLCVADAATGFIHSNGKWISANINVDDSRYIISQDEGQYSVTQFLRSMPIFHCEGPEIYIHIICKSGMSSFRINIETLRYMRAHPFGYLEEIGDTPYIEIGTCTKF